MLKRITAPPFGGQLTKGWLAMTLTNDTHKPYRKDKYFKIGSYTLQYIHYYPTYAAEVSYGWLFVRKEGLLDIYFGKHVFAFILRKNWYYDVG